MPPKPIHGSPEEWLDRARASLTLAKLDAPGVLLEDLCYQAQQAAEKALKAVFLKQGQPFPFTHDLDRLVLELEEMGLEITEEVDRVGLLTRYALETRYPYPSEPVDAEEHREAIRLAGFILAWAALRLGE